MMLTSFMDALSVCDDVQLVTLAHCDAVGRGHPLHQETGPSRRRNRQKRILQISLNAPHRRASRILHGRLSPKSPPPSTSAPRPPANGPNGSVGLVQKECPTPPRARIASADPLHKRWSMTSSLYAASASPESILPGLPVSRRRPSAAFLGAPG